MNSKLKELKAELLLIAKEAKVEPHELTIGLIFQNSNYTMRQIERRFAGLRNLRETLFPKPKNLAVIT